MFDCDDALVPDEVQLRDDARPIQLAPPGHAEPEVAHDVAVLRPREEVLPNGRTRVFGVLCMYVQNVWAELSNEQNRIHPSQHEVTGVEIEAPGFEFLEDPKAFLRGPWLIHHLLRMQFMGEGHAVLVVYGKDAAPDLLHGFEVDLPATLPWPMEPS